ncbi:hypothetical protein JOD64_000350 [Micromonospora luteifusca]|uniref:Uncharacterized protein n=1 Tax=Micromonospora luteifusca TaxID=709860 RepID=A0ABS2LMN9_9ACTN|nr:hypothetical protein [Micromonospora luteifusca]MBM7489128.1 hypothetical protein [Micromonospora luteifusca]
MVARRWDARFEEEHLVLRRWRLLPWPKAYVRRIPLAAILDIGSFTAADHAKRHAQLSVQDTSAPDLTEVIPVSFTREQWTFAGWFMEERRAANRRAAPTRPPQLRPKASSGQVALSRPTADVAALSRPAADVAALSRPAADVAALSRPAADVAALSRPAADVAALSRRRAQLAAALRAHLAARQASTTQPRAQLAAALRAHLAARQAATRLSTPSITPLMRAGDGKLPVWLWLEDGEIHGSLVSAGNASPRILGPADVADLLLADPSRAMPAIRALTGIVDKQLALAHLRSWQRPDRVVVNLSASDLAGRRVTEAPQKPGRSNPDGRVRTVSGGLPSLNNRRR